MTPVRAEMAGTGRYNPARVLTNADLERLVETDNEWIVERTGIKERRIADDHETIAFMGTAACRQVLEETGTDVADVDAIITATASPDRLLPSNACDLQAELGATNAAAWDMGAACSGFVYGVNMARSLVVSGDRKNVLVVGAERLSKIIDYEDRTTCILFGDGCGATLVRPATDPNRGILSTFLKSDGRLAELLYRPGGGAIDPPGTASFDRHSYYIKMAGRETFKHAVRSMSEACMQAICRAGLTADDIDLVIPHQANIRIIEATARHAGFPPERVYVNVDRYGNTSAASIPMALDECVREGRITEGSIVLLVAFGGGFTWGSLLVRW